MCVCVYIYIYEARNTSKVAGANYKLICMSTTKVDWNSKHRYKFITSKQDMLNTKHSSQTKSVIKQTLTHTHRLTHVLTRIFFLSIAYSG